MKRKDDAPASKADLAAGLGELRADLKGDIARLAAESVKTNARMEGMEQRLQTRMDAGFDRVTGAIDAFLSKLETYGRETTGIPHALDEHGKTLKDHERRLVKLERP